MSAPIGPGDFVECVDARPFDWASDVPLLTLGAIYRVRDVIVDALAPDGAERPSLLLEEIRLPVDPEWLTEPAFDAARFRPIYRPKSETFDHLLQPAPERELLDA